MYVDQRIELINEFDQVVELLKRKEYRVLWSAEGVEVVNRDMAVELLRAAYVDRN